MNSIVLNIAETNTLKIPKETIDRLFPNGFAKVDVFDDSILITPISKPRDGWFESFSSENEIENEILIDIKNKFDEEEWEW